MLNSKPRVVIQSVRVEPDPEQVLADQVQWVAIWPDGEITRHPAAIEVLREVKRRNKRDAERAERKGEAAIFATVIDWNSVPIGFVPPKTEDL